MTVGKSEQISSHRGADSLILGLGQPAVLLWRPDMLSAVPGDEEIGKRPPLSRHASGINAYESPVRNERRPRPPHKSLGIVVVEMVNQAECEYEIEPRKIGVEPRCVADAELRLVTERATRLLDVHLAQVDTHILHISQMRDELARTAADVQDACPGRRAHMFPYERAAAVFPTDESRPSLVDFGDGQDPADAQFFQCVFG